MNIYELITQHQTNSLVALKKDLVSIESTIQKIIREDEHLKCAGHGSKLKGAIAQRRV